MFLLDTVVLSELRKRDRHFESTGVALIDPFE